MRHLVANLCVRINFFFVIDLHGRGSDDGITQIGSTLDFLSDFYTLQIFCFLTAKIIVNSNSFIELSKSFKKITKAKKITLLS